MTTLLHARGGFIMERTGGVIKIYENKSKKIIQIAEQNKSCSVIGCSFDSTEFSYVGFAHIDEIFTRNTTPHSTVCVGVFLPLVPLFLFCVGGGVGQTI